MHDAIICEQAGTPATAVVTTAFQRLAELTAAGLGYHLPFVVIEHPVFNRSDDWFRTTARQIADNIDGYLRHE